MNAAPDAINILPDIINPHQKEQHIRQYIGSVIILIIILAIGLYFVFDSVYSLIILSGEKWVKVHDNKKIFIIIKIFIKINIKFLLFLL